MLHVALQLELQRLKLLGSGKLLGVLKFNADEYSRSGQVHPMIDARRWNPGPFHHLPHLIHQAKANFGVPLVLNNAPNAVQMESNWFIIDLDVHLGALDWKKANADLCFYGRPRLWKVYCKFIVFATRFCQYSEPNG